MIRKRGERSAEPFSSDKLCATLRGLAWGLSGTLDPTAVAREATDGACDGLRSDELGTLVAQLCAARAHLHPDYARLGGRVEMAQLHKATPARFTDAVRAQRACTVGGRTRPLVTAAFAALAEEHGAALDAALCGDRDFDFDFFGVRTLLKGYLLRGEGKAPMERPQHMYMRVALALHGAAGGVDDVVQAYHDMSRRLYSHASPTLFHAGTPLQQLSSCFLLGTYKDSVDGIYDTLKQCALISKTAGGIGLAVSDIRARGSYIEGTQGQSNGLVPMLRVFNDTARYIDQGGGRRRGALAVYIEPWHADICDVLDMKRPQGAEELRARDLFYALWIPDLFMRRVHDDGDWALFCPDECPGLAGVHGDAFVQLYEKYEREGRAKFAMRARELWSRILETQMETGGPYMLYKDACNAKSNHQHLGTIRCSNLCTEIVQYTDEGEVAVCNLGSLCLPSFVRADAAGGFDYGALHGAAKRLAVALDRVIDVNYYPVEEARASNRRHRPVGIGVQGLADVFAELSHAYDSEAARALNRNIFETIQHAALEASCEAARARGPYETYAGSPASQGRLQCDLWGEGAAPRFGRWDWAALRAAIAEHGLRNSLLTAPMPTASTAQIAGNTESFEPATSNVYVRRVLSGEFLVVNPRLVRALEAEGVWPAVRPALLQAGGSLRDVEGVSEHTKAVFRTVWEMKQRPIIDMAADRGAFIDQSQSLNVFMGDATAEKLTALHMHVWKKGLKGTYYLHSRAPREAVQFALIGENAARAAPAEEAACESCSA